VTFEPYDEPPPGGCDEVVLALPPLAGALPIAWDRYVRNRLRHPYETWLEAVLSDPPADWPTVRSFWEHHHYDVLVERWQSVVGDRLVIRVTPGLPDGQRALSASEAEVVRRVNVAFHNREWPAQRYDQVVRQGVLAALLRRSPGPTDGPVVTPGWAIEQANAIAAADAPKIVASGVRIDGDLAELSKARVPRNRPADDLAPLSIDAAADAVVGALEAVATTWPR
jgi:hypothetical protein